MPKFNLQDYISKVGITNVDKIKEKADTILAVMNELEFHLSGNPGIVRSLRELCPTCKTTIGGDESGEFIIISDLIDAIDTTSVEYLLKVLKTGIVLDKTISHNVSQGGR